MATTDNLVETTRITQVALEALELVNANSDADVWVDRARNSMEQAVRFLELARIAELEAGNSRINEKEQARSRRRSECENPASTYWQSGGHQAELLEVCRVRCG